MPKYRFTCTKCGNEKMQYANLSTFTVECDKCKANMERQLPSSGSQAVNETVDNYTGVKRDQNHDELKKQRRDQYYRDVEIPRLIQTYSLETCLEQKWLVYNDKGDLVINKEWSSSR